MGFFWFLPGLLLAGVRPTPQELLQVTVKESLVLGSPGEVTAHLLFETLSRVPLPVASFLPGGYVLLVVIKKDICPGGRSPHSWALWLVLSSCLSAGAHVCTGCAESRAVKCFMNSRKLKTGLSQRRKSCKNLLCLRGVQGREWRSVRNQGQVPFLGTCKFKRKVTLGH